MIRIQVQEHKGKIDRITAKGHALAGDPGMDLVCAGVSAILAGGQNALDEQFPGACSFIYDPGHSETAVIQDSDSLQTALQFWLGQLKSLQESYPDNISLNRKEVQSCFSESTFSSSRPKKV